MCKFLIIGTVGKICERGKFDNSVTVFCHVLFLYKNPLVIRGHKICFIGVVIRYISAPDKKG